MSVDLRNCKVGDILISQHGSIFRYVKPLDAEIHYYDHQIECLYFEGIINTGQIGKGTRIHDGHSFRKNRLESDHNIVQIIPLEDWKKIKKF